MHKNYFTLIFVYLCLIKYFDFVVDWDWKTLQQLFLPSFSKIKKTLRKWFITSSKFLI